MAVQQVTIAQLASGTPANTDAVIFADSTGTAYQTQAWNLVRQGLVPPNSSTPVDITIAAQQSTTSGAAGGNINLKFSNNSAVNIRNQANSTVFSFTGSGFVAPGQFSMNSTVADFQNQIALNATEVSPVGSSSEVYVGDNNIIYLQPSQDFNLLGISTAQEASVLNGTFLTIKNNSNFNVTLKDNSSANPTNKLVIGSDYQLQEGSAIHLVYTQSSGGWGLFAPEQQILPLTSGNVAPIIGNDLNNNLRYSNNFYLENNGVYEGILWNSGQGGLTKNLSTEDVSISASYLTLNANAGYVPSLNFVQNTSQVTIQASQTGSSGNYTLTLPESFASQSGFALVGSTSGKLSWANAAGIYQIINSPTASGVVASGYLAYASSTNNEKALVSDVVKVGLIQSNTNVKNDLTIKPSNVTSGNVGSDLILQLATGTSAYGNLNISTQISGNLIQKINDKTITNYVPTVENNQTITQVSSGNLWSTYPLITIASGLPNLKISSFTSSGSASAFEGQILTVRNSSANYFECVEDASVLVGGISVPDSAPSIILAPNSVNKFQYISNKWNLIGDYNYTPNARIILASGFTTSSNSADINNLILASGSTLLGTGLELLSGGRGFQNVAGKPLTYKLGYTVSFGIGGDLNYRTAALNLNGLGSTMVAASMVSIPQTGNNGLSLSAETIYTLQSGNSFVLNVSQFTGTFPVESSSNRGVTQMYAELLK